MPWVKAKLRGTEVFARANADGSLALISGRVEVRYKANDGRMYSAGERNLTVLDGPVLPDDACGPAEAVQKAAKTASKTASTGRSKKVDKAAAAAAASKPVVAPEGGLIAYTDGACTGNPGPAGCGVVLVDGDERVELVEYLGQGTNNIAELTAILRAVEDPRSADRPMIVHTDSQYAIGVLTKGWKAKKNGELIASLKEALAGRPKTQIVYVPGHAGVPLNERADELAREAISVRGSSRREVADS